MVGKKICLYMHILLANFLSTINSASISHFTIYLAVLLEDHTAHLGKSSPPHNPVLLTANMFGMASPIPRHSVGLNYKALTVLQTPGQRVQHLSTRTPI